jgi:PST family polysaccharide transporter
MRVPCDDLPKPEAPASTAARGRTNEVPVSRRYREILGASALMGGSSLASILIGLVRVKFTAVLLGPAGFGLLGTLSAIADLARSLAELGINQSGVRQIAAAEGAGDGPRIAATSTALRASGVVLGILGSVLVLAAAGLIAEVTFGDRLHNGDVALLSVTVFFGVVAGAQMALLQGLRRIRVLATVAVLNALLGSIATVAILYAMPRWGIPLSLVVGAGISAALAWWHARRLSGGWQRLPVRQVATETMAMLQLGVAFLASGLLMMGAAYVMRVLVLRGAGLEASGFFQCAWTLGGLYVAFILQSMGTDFYPRLVGSIENHGLSNDIVNDQAHVSLLLAAPGLLITLGFAPQILALLYSPAFVQAADTLRWICLGMALRVVIWPIGYIVIAKGRRRLFVATDALWVAANLLLGAILIPRIGVAGAGIAFFAAYLLHGIVIQLAVRRLTGFRWSAPMLQASIVFMALIVLILASVIFLPSLGSLAVCAFLCAVSCCYSIRVLRKAYLTSDLPAGAQKLAMLLGRRPHRSAAS